MDSNIVFDCKIVLKNHYNLKTICFITVRDVRDLVINVSSLFILIYGKMNWLLEF